MSEKWIIKYKFLSYINNEYKKLCLVKLKLKNTNFTIPNPQSDKVSFGKKWF